jgi:hypothetical protein
VCERERDCVRVFVCVRESVYRHRHHREREKQLQSQTQRDSNTHGERAKEGSTHARTGPPILSIIQSIGKGVRRLRNPTP